MLTVGNTMPPLLSRFLRGLLLCAGVLVSVATSRVGPPAPTYQVDLLTRTQAVYALRSVGAAEGGQGTLQVQISASAAVFTEPDGGEPTGDEARSAQEVVVYLMDRQPTLEEVSALRSFAPVEGALQVGRAPAQSPFISGEVAASEEARWMIFTRTGAGSALTVSFFLPCDEGCGDVLLEDVTVTLE